MNSSIIVPAYNESRRIVPFLTELLSYAKKNLNDYEVLIVNDGSRDNTESVVKNIIKNDRNAKLIGYEQNRGKGGAVQYGVSKAKGNKVLFIDADGSIKPEEIKKMLDELDRHDVVVGDRLSKKSDVETTALRGFISFGFNTLVSALFQYGYRDNLCGFKGFKKEVAKEIFRDLIDKRWVFDVELFYKIKKRKYDLYFMPIAWRHVRGSKINLLKDPVVWFIRLLTLRLKLISYR